MARIISLLLLSLVVSSSHVHGADLELARKEGEVVLYTTMVGSDYQIFQKAIVKKYPFLKVNHVRIGTVALAGRAVAEHRAGKQLADVFGLSPDSMNFLRDQGVLTQYISPEAKFMHKGFSDAKGYWSGITTDVLVSGINTSQLNAKRAPRSYADYLKPEFRGKMAFHIGTNNPLIGMAELQGEEKALAYMRNFAKQDLIQHNGYTKIAQLLAAGEFSIVAFMQVTKLEKIRERGGPVDWNPLDPSFATVSSVAVAKNAPRPNAARLLVDFYLSDEGQKALQEIDKIPLRRGVDADSKRVGELIEQTPHVIKYEGDAGRHIRQFNEIFWGGKKRASGMNILFDLDGTLTDPREGILACIKYALDELKVESPADRTLEGLIGPPLRESFATLLGADHDERIDRAISLYRERFSSKGPYENVVYPGIRDALEQLREAECAHFVATSKPRVYAQRIIDHFELGVFFQAVYGSELDGTNAGKARLIAHVLSVESLLPSETMMIGDRAHDIVGAKVNGIASIGVLWGYGSRQELVAAGAQTLCEEPGALVEAVSLVDVSKRCVSGPSSV